MCGWLEQCWYWEIILHQGNICQMWTFRKSRCWNGVWPVHGEVLASGWEAMLQVHAVWKAKLTKDQCPESHWKCSVPGSFQLQLWPLQENIQDQKGSVQPCVYGAQILKNCDELFIRLLRSVNFVIIRSNIIKSLAFTVLLVSLSASSVLFHYWAHHIHVCLKRFSWTFMGGGSLHTKVRKRPQAKQ